MAYKMQLSEFLYKVQEYINEVTNNEYWFDYTKVKGFLFLKKQDSHRLAASCVFRHSTQPERSLTRFPIPKATSTRSISAFERYILHECSTYSDAGIISISKLTIEFHANSSQSFTYASHSEANTCSK